jgi:hypothetical protein
MDNLAFSKELEIDFVTHKVTLNIPYFELTSIPKSGYEKEHEASINEFCSGISKNKNLIIIRDNNKVQVFIKWDFGPYISQSLWNMASNELLPLDIAQAIAGKIILKLCQSCLPDIVKITNKSAQRLKDEWNKKTKEIDG